MSTAEIAAAVRAVLDAARDWSAGVQAQRAEGFHAPLADAVESLDTALAAAGPIERDMSWGEVLAGDEVQGADGRWYPVRHVIETPNPRAVDVGIEISGKVRDYRKDLYLSVRVRRPAGAVWDAVSVLTAAGFDVTTIASGGA